MFLTLALMKMSGQLHPTVPLPQEKGPHYHLDRKAGWVPQLVWICLQEKNLSMNVCNIILCGILKVLFRSSFMSFIEYLAKV